MRNNISERRICDANLTELNPLMLQEDITSIALASS